MTADQAEQRGTLELEASAGFEPRLVQEQHPRSDHGLVRENHAAMLSDGAVADYGIRSSIGTRQSGMHVLLGEAMCPRTPRDLERQAK
ncbi:hypothetical protein ACWGQ5_32320 [Streptomyces sp. NPDC055722]